MSGRQYLRQSAAMLRKSLSMNFRCIQIELEMQNEALREARITLEESRDNYLDPYEFAMVGYLTLTK
jgi:hypothetical protein